MLSLSSEAVEARLVDFEVKAEPMRVDSQLSPAIICDDSVHYEQATNLDFYTRYVHEPSLNLCPLIVCSKESFEMSIDRLI